MRQCLLARSDQLPARHGAERIVDVAGSVRERFQLTWNSLARCGAARCCFVCFGGLGQQFGLGLVSAVAVRVA